MPNEPSPPKRAFNVGAIQAWIALGGTVGGLLTGLVKSSQSAYNPVDTVLIFIATLACILFGFAWVGMFVAGGIYALLGEDNQNSLVPVIIIGILVLVTAVPLGIESATDTVQDGDLDFTGITGMRFMGVGVIGASGWLVHKYILADRKPTP